MSEDCSKEIGCGPWELNKRRLGLMTDFVVGLRNNHLAATFRKLWHSQLYSAPMEHIYE